MRRLPAILLSFVSILALVPAPAVAAAETSRTVYVTVVDNEGRPVTGLTPADFVLKEGGKERAIVSVEPAREKARLALMVEDTMTSFIGLRQGLADFVVRMCPTAEIALIVVANRAETMVDYTSDAGVLAGGDQEPLAQSPGALHDGARRGGRGRQGPGEEQAGASRHRAAGLRDAVGEQRPPAQHPEPGRAKPRHLLGCGDGGRHGGGRGRWHARGHGGPGAGDG